MANPARPRALVTGASAGIGAAYAERLALNGHDLILVARRQDRLEALRDRLRKERGVDAEVLVADLASGDDLARVEARIRKEPLALLVNNAGFGGYRPFVELGPKVLDELLEVHVRASSRLAHAALPAMVKANAGGIINVASLLAFSGTLPPKPLPHRAIYAGAKAFLVAFSQTLAGELVGTQVRVQVCLPGLVPTEFHEVQGFDRSHLPPPMSAEDVVTASLAALARGEVTCVPGLEDPALLDRLAEAQRAVLMSANKATLAARYREAKGA